LTLEKYPEINYMKKSIRKKKNSVRKRTTQGKEEQRKARVHLFDE